MGRVGGAPERTRTEHQYRYRIQISDPTSEGKANSDIGEKPPISQQKLRYRTRYRARHHSFLGGTPFLPLPITEFVSRYRSFFSDITVLSQPIFRITRFLPLAISGISGHHSGHRVRYGMRYQDIRTSQLKSYDVGQDIRIYGHLHCCRCQGGYVTCRAAAALRPHWPLPRGSNCSGLLVLRPFRVSVYRWNTPDTLASYTFLVLVGWLSLTDCQPESLCSRKQT